MTEKCQDNLKNYIKGKDVDKNLIDGRSILGQLAVGLSYLHGKEIIHKDLKPANILIWVSTELALVKLADFGFSRKLSEGKTSFDATYHLGARIYRAPEIQQTDEEGKAKPSWQSDVWSLGAIFFFVISNGQHAYDVEGIPPEDKSKLIEKLRQPPNMGCIIDDKNNLYVSDLILCLLKFDPENRPSAHLVVHHPYFTSHNETTVLYWAWRATQFFETSSAKHSKDLLTRPKLMQWCKEYGKSPLTDKQRNEIEEFCSRYLKKVREFTVIRVILNKPY